MDLKILRGGMLTTVQDLGRRGFRGVGVPLSGAMDAFALRTANSLVGNAEGAAALEFTLIGPDIEFSEDALVAVAGVECESIPSWRPFEIKAGERVKLGAIVRGCRGYLAVHGGIDVPLVLGSRSTYLSGGWGGFEGRGVREGDQLKIGVQQLKSLGTSVSKFAWQIDPRMLPRYSTTPTIRVTRGMPPIEGADELFATTFTVSPQSNRMGLRLAGEQIPSNLAGDLPSSAVVPGTVQVPPDGHPLILMADAQTIGGYPQVAHVICVDLPLVAQVRPGDSLRFVEVSLEEAHRLAWLRDRSVAMLREGLGEKLAAMGARHRRDAH